MQVHAAGVEQQGQGAEMFITKRWLSYFSRCRGERSAVLFERGVNSFACWGSAIINIHISGLVVGLVVLVY